jgi:hypothetical protein
MTPRGQKRVVPVANNRSHPRSPERLDTRAGHDSHQLQTQAGELTLKGPRLRSAPFETQIRTFSSGGQIHVSISIDVAYFSLVVSQDD